MSCIPLHRESLCPVQQAASEPSAGPTAQGIHSLHVMNEVLSFASRVPLIIGHTEESRGNSPSNHYLCSVRPMRKPGSERQRMTLPWDHRNYVLHPFQEPFFIVIFFFPFC